MHQISVKTPKGLRNCYLSPTSIGAETDEQLIASIKNLNGIWTPIFEQLHVSIDDKGFRGEDYSIESYVKIGSGSKLLKKEGK